MKLAEKGWMCLSSPIWANAKELPVFVIGIETSMLRLSSKNQTWCGISHTLGIGGRAPTITMVFPAGKVSFAGIIQ